MSRDHKVKLEASDGQIFEVDVLVACQSQTVKNVIEDTGTDTEIPLPEVSSDSLSKVIEYCTHHVQAQESKDEKTKQEQERFDWKMEQAHKLYDENFTQSEQKRFAEIIKQGQKRFHEETKHAQNSFDEEIKQWDAEFMKVDRETLKDLVLTANYLNIQNLLYLTSQTYADLINAMSAEEIRMFLNNENDSTR